MYIQIPQSYGKVNPVFHTFSQSHDPAAADGKPGFFSGVDGGDFIFLCMCGADIGKISGGGFQIIMYNPIPGTPYENNVRLTEEEMCRIVALFRFILPQAFIRLAGGRGLMKDQGRKCFQSGANAAITGDMLTTSGITIQRDLQLLQELGYRVADL